MRRLLSFGSECDRLCKTRPSSSSAPSLPAFPPGGTYAVEMHGGLRAGRLDLTWSFAGVRPRRLQHRLLADFRTALAGFGALASPMPGRREEATAALSPMQALMLRESLAARGSGIYIVQLVTSHSEGTRC